MLASLLIITLVRLSKVCWWWCIPIAAETISIMKALSKMLLLTSIKQCECNVEVIYLRDCIKVGLMNWKLRGVEQRTKRYNNEYHKKISKPVFELWERYSQLSTWKTARKTTHLVLSTNTRKDTRSKSLSATDAQPSDETAYSYVYEYIVSIRESRRGTALTRQHASLAVPRCHPDCQE